MDLNGGQYTGGPLQQPAGQAHPGKQVPDHRDAAGVASAATNVRITAVVGIICGCVPLLSPIGLILGFVALHGYRKISGKPTLAVVAIAVSGLVILASVVYLFVSSASPG
jgi:hypothetical protein